MPRDLTHAVLEGLDEAKSTGGLVIMKKKKEGGEEEKGGFKLPVGPSKLGLDRCEPLRVCKDFEELPVPLRLAAAKEKERRNQELKDALEESERKMQEVEIIEFTNKCLIPFTPGEECAKASGGGGEGGGGKEDP